MGEPLDYDRLEEFLRVLAYSARLELVDMLREPKPVADIRLTPRQVRPGENPDRPIARQTLQEHLDKLAEIGVVTTREAPQGKRAKEYVVNPQRLYQITEEFRKVGLVASRAPAPRDDTVEARSAVAPAATPGPHLVVVHGFLEGRAFPLKRADLREGRGWIVGRKAGLQVALEYDPFVSTENAEIVPENGGFRLLDLRSSKNGTLLNWRQLDTDERARLKPGDVIGVGRSLLVFRDE